MTDQELLKKRLRNGIAKHEKMLEVFTADNSPISDVAVARRRRGLRPSSTKSTFYLCRSNGALYWDTRAAVVVPGLRRGRRRGLIPSDFIDKIIAAPLNANMIASFLADLDSTWNKANGLKRWNGKTLNAIDSRDVSKAGKILLIVHGTFSNADAITKPLFERGFLGSAARRYDQILAFDHPTISVSPVMNALDLARSLAGSKADIDVISHSRGGLVARWWLETLDRAPGARRVMFVGSPLEGTSLATPRSIRSLMNWFSNLSEQIGELSGAASSMLPFLSVVAGLARLSSTVTDVASKIPAADAALSMVPGLSAMSRESFELIRSHYANTKRPEYFAVTSNFQPDDVGWAFWRAFQDNPKLRVANAFIDPLFNGDNDLVVDTGSMTFLTGNDVISKKRVLAYGTNNSVHHVNYFEQQKTLDWIKLNFEIP